MVAGKTFPAFPAHAQPAILRHQFLSSCRFADLHWTHTVKDSRGVRKYLLGVFGREYAQDVVRSLGYPIYILCDMRGCLFQTGTFKFRYSKGCICNSPYHHEIGSVNLSHWCNGCVLVHQLWLYHHIVSVSYTHTHTHACIYSGKYMFTFLNRCAMEPYARFCSVVKPYFRF